MGEDEKEREVFKLKILPWFSKVPNSPSPWFLWWVEQVLSWAGVKLGSFLSFPALTWSKGQICLFCMQVKSLFFFVQSAVNYITIKFNLKKLNRLHEWYSPNESLQGFKGLKARIQCQNQSWSVCSKKQFHHIFNKIVHIGEASLVKLNEGSQVLLVLLIIFYQLGWHRISQNFPCLQIWRFSAQSETCTCALSPSMQTNQWPSEGLQGFIFWHRPLKSELLRERILFLFLQL